MRSKFPGFYPNKDAAFFERLWRDGTFVFDASMLLNFFRYSASTRDSLYAFLDANKTRLWIPYQAAAEYHRNLHIVRSEPVDALNDLLKQLEERRNRLRDEDHRERFDALIKQVSELRKSASKKIQDEVEWVDHIADLFDGRVGECWAESKISALVKEGEDRYRKRIPPGFKDSQKGGDAQYGDLLLWKQILERAISIQGIVFVTDDLKDDWWLSVEGQRQPRPELIGEISQAAPNCAFHMYSGQAFLQYANQNLNANVSAAAIDEVKQVNESRGETEFAKLAAIRSDLTPRDLFLEGYRVGLESQGMRGSLEDLWGELQYRLGRDGPLGPVWAGRFYRPMSEEFAPVLPPSKKDEE